MKKQVLFLLQFFILTLTFAQPSELIMKSGSKGYYLEHTTAVHEGLYPIGRMYNVHPKHIAGFNSIDINKGLSIGQKINIPLSDTNFNQTGNKGVPVYYKTTEKEGLLSISNRNNKVQLNNLRNWNNLSGDQAPAGTSLIIGFLITNEMKDRVVVIADKKKETVAPPVEEKKKEVVEVKKEPEVKNEEPKKIEPIIIKEDIKKTEPEAKKEAPQVIKEEPKKMETVAEKKQENNPNESGYFKIHFYQQIKSSPVTKEQTVTSSIFKTASGWQDEKYYLLINGVQPGTIVKLTNPTSNKIIFAKVLYAMESIKQNLGLDMRISDAAASALAITETDKFILKVNY